MRWTFGTEPRRARVLTRPLSRTRGGGAVQRGPLRARLRARAFCVARDRPLGVRKAKKGTSGQRQWHTSWFGEVAAGAGCASTRDDWSVSRRSDSRHDLHGSRSAADRLPPRWSIRAGGRRHRRRLVKDLGRRRPHNPDFLASCVNFFFFLLLLYVHDLRRYTVSYLSYLSRHRAAGRRDPPPWPAGPAYARGRGAVGGAELWPPAGRQVPTCAIHNGSIYFGAERTHVNTRIHFGPP